MTALLYNKIVVLCHKKIENRKELDYDIVDEGCIRIKDVPAQ